MKSVPPRSSGRVTRLRKADFGLQIEDAEVLQPTVRESAIYNRQSAIGTPTRYREVVLTSRHCDEWERDKA